LTYEEREEEKAEQEKAGDMEIAYEVLIKKYGKKKVMDTFARLSKS
jgi:hypothetical protein